LIAIDTNILLRLILDDEPSQGKAARKLLATSKLFVPITVAMETEWVLRAAYGLSRSQIADAIESIVNMENMEFEISTALLWSVARYRDGADFADMIHIIASKEKEMDAFATFDKRLEKQAILECPIKIQTIR
jgi:predicted nucleic-acid-binding protein